MKTGIPLKFRKENVGPPLPFTSGIKIITIYHRQYHALMKTADIGPKTKKRKIEKVVHGTVFVAF